MANISKKAGEYKEKAKQGYDQAKEKTKQKAKELKCKTESAMKGSKKECK